MAQIEQLFRPTLEETKIAQSAFLQRIDFIRTEPTDDLKFITPENAAIVIDQALRIAHTAASARTAEIIREETEHIRQVMSGKCIIFPIEKTEKPFDKAGSRTVQ